MKTGEHTQEQHDRCDRWAALMESAKMMKMFEDGKFYMDMWVCVHATVNQRSIHYSTVIDEHGKTFNIDEILAEDPKPLEANCNTAGCALGWAVMEFDELHFDLDVGEMPVVVDGGPDEDFGAMHSHDIYINRRSALCDFFGITPSQFDSITSPGSYSGDDGFSKANITPLDVAERIREIMAEYEVTE